MTSSTTSVGLEKIKEQIRQIIRERRIQLSRLAGIIREIGSLKTFIFLMHNLLQTSTTWG